MPVRVIVKLEPSPFHENPSKLDPDWMLDWRKKNVGKPKYISWKTKIFQMPCQEVFSIQIFWATTTTTTK